ncbi:MarR family winged helix-turn-helix transcriptional regulator [Gynurincola endophyticus]|jgi:DNA-binding MarR family transcriptional regulator|uniref:MarR family winged helix-turn-helix transcriptional regulator n=1 Tax=Gynurincola endophyticus TaxID=2479004 RepID=UPI000F8F7822|nr:MarR family winged helix-turn-helix transcriptional regulator [Gynurincola endophyticus]
MNYDLIKNVLDLVEDFESAVKREKLYTNDANGFRNWISDNFTTEIEKSEPGWEGKDKGRTAESVISTLIVHLNRYAKTYAKSAIYDSGFSTQEEFVYLINLKAFGVMTKIELIKKNIQDKPTGMQIINRLIKHGWVEQNESEVDKRSKMINITEKGLTVLDQQMIKIRQATQIVAGNLTHQEKMSLIRILNKLNDFHYPIFTDNVDTPELLDSVIKKYSLTSN